MVSIIFQVTGSRVWTVAQELYLDAQSAYDEVINIDGAKIDRNREAARIFIAALRKTTMGVDRFAQDVKEPLGIAVALAADEQEVWNHVGVPGGWKEFDQIVKDAYVRWAVVYLRLMEEGVHGDMRQNFSLAKNYLTRAGLDLSDNATWVKAGLHGGLVELHGLLTGRGIDPAKTGIDFSAIAPPPAPAGIPAADGPG